MASVWFKKGTGHRSVDAEAWIWDLEAVSRSSQLVPHKSTPDLRPSAFRPLMCPFCLQLLVPTFTLTRSESWFCSCLGHPPRMSSHHPAPPNSAEQAELPPLDFHYTLNFIHIAWHEADYSLYPSNKEDWLSHQHPIPSSGTDLGKSGHWVSRALFCIELIAVPLSPAH